MLFPIVVIHRMSEHEVVVDDLWVLEGGGLPHSTFFTIPLCLLPIVMIIGPIHPIVSPPVVMIIGPIHGHE